MKSNFRIFNFVLVVGLGLSFASCGDKPPTSPPQVKQDQPPSTSPQAAIETPQTSVSPKPEICKTATVSECERAKLQLSEVELEQIRDQLIGEIGHKIPLGGVDRTQPLKSDVLATQQAWLQYRDKSCDFRIALGQTAIRGQRGSSLDPERAICKDQMNRERIKEISTIIEEQKRSSADSSTSNTPTVFKVQSLSNGDHFFTDGEPPRYSGAFFLFRKQGNIIIGWGGEHNSDGNSCLRKVILPDSRVETTTVTVELDGRGEVPDNRTTSTDDGTFGNSELSKVPVDQYPYPDSAKQLQACAKKFSN